MYSVTSRKDNLKIYLWDFRSEQLLQEDNVKSKGIGHLCVLESGNERRKKGKVLDAEKGQFEDKNYCIN